MTLQEAWPGLAVAAGSGLLIGIDRERRKGSGPQRQPAGIRSFTLAALAGAMTQAQGEPLLAAAGALAVLLLAAIAYGRSRSDDPGLTTELGLFATYVTSTALAWCSATLAGHLP